MATLGICLLAISCGDKNDNSTATPPEETAAPAKDETAAPAKAPAAVSESEEKPAPKEAAPTGDLESQAVGYWAPDAKAMMGFLAEDLKDEPESLAAMQAMMEPMLAGMAVHIPEKGKIVMHMMGEQQTATYTVKSVEEATKTLSVEITDPDGATESGSIIIGEDRLELAGDNDRIALTRIDEAAFKKRQEAKVPNILDLPDDGSEEDAVVEEPAAEEAPNSEEVVPTEPEK